MEKNAKIRSQLIRIGEVLIMIAFIGCLYQVFSGKPMINELIAGVTIPALCCAFVYLMKGATKEVAIYYKVMAALYALIQLLLIVHAMGAGSLPVVVKAVVFGLAVVLAAGRNIGEKVSIICAGLIVLARLVDIFHCIWRDPFYDGFGSLVFSDFILAVILLTCVYGKYLDKRDRGTT